MDQLMFSLVEKDDTIRCPNATDLHTEGVSMLPRQTQYTDTMPKFSVSLVILTIKICYYCQHWMTRTYREIGLPISVQNFLQQLQFLTRVGGSAAGH